MNIKTIIILAFCILSGVNIQSAAKNRNIHAEAHKQQLAAAKNTGLDKATINRMVEEDIAARENSKAISHETDVLLNDLLSEARSHLGKRYSRGSKGPKAFDCSGFSSYVYRQFGYSLSPSSRDQYNQGESVTRSELRKGDLVFFKGRSTKGGVGHVGIVVNADENGNFSFIHASTSSGIVISSCNEPYYAKRYVGSKRIIE
ncbi:MAG: C40 family peptidase [Muribaculum sp.]|nr:C40 family peptidase [Muribaculum sp.]